MIGRMDGQGECVGVVLAGGRSSRMGRDKALLPWRGRRLIDYAVDTLRQTGCARVLVSGNYAGYQCVADQFPDRGPLGGLASVAQVVRNGLLLVVAVDQPLLTPALLRLLLDGITSAHARGLDACRYGEEPLPMAITLNLSLCEWLQDAVGGEQGLRSLQALHRHLRTLPLPLPTAQRHQLASANTPQDWQALLLLD